MSGVGHSGLETVDGVVDHVVGACGAVDGFPNLRIDPFVCEALESIETLRGGTRWDFALAVFGGKGGCDESEAEVLFLKLNIILTNNLKDILCISRFSS